MKACFQTELPYPRSFGEINHWPGAFICGQTLCLQGIRSETNPLLSPLLSQNKTLEQETSQLEKDKKLLEKENKRLRQQAEIRDSKLDDDNQRISALEKENRTMGKEMIFFRDSCTRVKDLERENKELVKQGSIDKKTLIALREVRMELLKTNPIQWGEWRSCFC